MVEAISDARRQELLADGVISVEKAAELSSLSTTTIRAKTKDGTIAGFRVGRRLLVSRRSLDEFIGTGLVTVN